MIVRRQEELNGRTSEKFVYIPVGRTEPEDGIGLELIDDDEGKWVVFDMVDRSYSAGILRFTHETSLVYDFNADMWSGYEIGVEDWDFTPREAAERAREFMFDRAVHELCVFLGVEPPAFNLPPEIELPPDYVRDSFDDECVLIPSDLAFKLMACYAAHEAVDDETVVELLKTVSGASLEDCPQAFREAMATRLENGAAKQQGRRI